MVLSTQGGVRFPELWPRSQLRIQLDIHRPPEPEPTGAIPEERETPPEAPSLLLPGGLWGGAPHPESAQSPPAKSLLGSGATATTSCTRQAGLQSVSLLYWGVLGMESRAHDHRATSPALWYFISYFKAVSISCPGWPWTCSPPVSASGVAGITDVYCHEWHDFLSMVA